METKKNIPRKLYKLVLSERVDGLYFIDLESNIEFEMPTILLFFKPFNGEKELITLWHVDNLEKALEIYPAIKKFLECIVKKQVSIYMSEDDLIEEVKKNGQ